MRERFSAIGHFYRGGVFTGFASRPPSESVRRFVLQRLWENGGGRSMRGSGKDSGIPRKGSESSMEGSGEAMEEAEGQLQAV